MFISLFGDMAFSERRFGSNIKFWSPSPGIDTRTKLYLSQNGQAPPPLLPLAIISTAKP
jgi:hypothetical protein